MRRELRNTLIVIAAATALGSCSTPAAPIRAVENTPQPPNPGLRFSVPDEPATRSPLVTPTGIPTETPTPTATSTTTETPTLVTDKDTKTKRILQEASVGEVIKLPDQNVGYVVRMPWIGRPGHFFGEAVVVTYDSNLGPKRERLAVSTQGDCVLNALKQNNELGETVFPGTWNPNKHVDEVTLEVVGSTNAAGLPIPIVETKTIQKNGVVYECEQVSGADRLKDLIKSVDWGQKAEDIGRVIASKVYRFILGIKDGIATSTPVLK